MKGSVQLEGADPDSTCKQGFTDVQGNWDIALDLRKSLTTGATLVVRLLSFLSRCSVLWLIGYTLREGPAGT